MARDHDRGAVALAGTFGDHVARRVDFRVAIAERDHTLTELYAARLLLERRRGNLAELHLVLDNPVVPRLDGVERLLDAGVVGGDVALRRKPAGKHAGKRERRNQRD